MAVSTSITVEDVGVTSSAILMLALGEESAADVFKHLAPKEVQRLGERMARLTTVADDQFDDVLARFQEQVQLQRSLVSDTGAYVSAASKASSGWTQRPWPS